eukprot:6455787-Amphidinium_carterae.1
MDGTGESRHLVGGGWRRVFSKCGEGSCDLQRVDLRGLVVRDRLLESLNDTNDFYRTHCFAEAAKGHELGTESALVLSCHEFHLNMHMHAGN